MNVFNIIVMYLLSFGLFVVLFGTVLGLAFWLVRAAWLIAMRLR
jgi:hypothetical protein